jgi:tetratricopeptide (TPR) repeat protein
MTIPAKRYLEIALLMVVLVLGLHLNILDNEATNWDDPAIFNRTALHEITAENVGKILSVSKLSTFQPVRDLSYMADFAIWGPTQEGVVFGMHLTGIVLYALMILACWLFLLELFRAFTDDEKLAFTWATLSSIIFAVHPVHVESVAWLFARKEPLMGIFTFLCLWAFIRGRNGRWGYYAASVAFMVLAVLSKPIALMIPAVVAALDVAIHLHRPRQSFWKTRAFVYLPMLLIAAGMGVRLLLMMYAAGGVKPYHGGSFFTNLLAVSQIFASYLSLIALTINYAADYAIRLYADPGAWQAWAYVGVNLVLISSAVFALVKRHYLYAFFVAWFYIFLVPVAHIFPISQIMADRYALLPSLSWSVLLGYGLSRLWRLRLDSGRFSPEFPLLVSVALLGVIVLSYSFMTFRQNDIWQDSQTLWEDTLAKYPNSSPANVNLSAIYLAQQRFPEVQDLCITAIKAKPYDYLAISNLALAQMMMGQYGHAINNYQQALKLKPDLYKARKGLAHSYWLAGDYEHAYPAFADLFARGLVGGKDSVAQYHHRAGFAAWKVGKREEALKHLASAEKHARNNPYFLRDIASAYTTMGEMHRARAAFERLYPLVEDEEQRHQLDRILNALEKMD